MASSAAGQPVARAASIRAQNSQLVVAALREIGASTRADLASVTSLTSQALGPILNELREAGLVTSRNETRSGPGRPPKIYEFNARSSFDVDIAYLFESITVVLSDATGAAISTDTITADAAERGLDLIEPWREALEQLLGLHRIDVSELASVNVSIPGRVDEEKLIIHDRPRCNQRDVPLGDLLRPYLRRGTTITLTDTDKSVARSCISTADDDELVAVLILGNSPKLFLASAGTIIDGRRGLTNDLRHVPVPGNDRQCSCGRIGCVTTIFGSEAGLARYRRAVQLDVEPTLGDLMRAIRSGDPMARFILDEAFVELARAIAGLLTYLAPDRLQVADLRLVGSEHVADIFRDVLSDAHPDLLIEAVDVVT